MAERFVTYETENPGVLVDPDGTMRPVVMISADGPTPSINVSFRELSEWIVNKKPFIVMLNVCGYGGELYSVGMLGVEYVTTNTPTPKMTFVSSVTGTAMCVLYPDDTLEIATLN